MDQTDVSKLGFEPVFCRFKGKGPDGTTARIDVYKDGTAVVRGRGFTGPSIETMEALQQFLKANKITAI